MGGGFQEKWFSVEFEDKEGRGVKTKFKKNVKGLRDEYNVLLKSFGGGVHQKIILHYKRGGGISHKGNFVTKM